MARKTLAGRLILIEEDEALISMEIENSFKAAGARVHNLSGGQLFGADPGQSFGAV